LKPSVIFLSETMPLGGTSTFAMNICEGMRTHGNWLGVAAGLRKLNEMGEQIRNLGLPLIAPDPAAVLHEERIEHVYRECAKHAPRAVVAALSAGSFDFLRFVPEHCIRIGMIQSDDEAVYELVEQYLPWLDAVVGVSSEICRKMQSRLGGRRIPVVQQPYGVPMPAVIPQRDAGERMRILYIGRVSEDQKRVSVMARVIKRTLERSTDLEWTIAGDGPEFGFLKTELAGLDRIRFLGAVPYRDVPAVLELHDVYFLCSEFEGLPLSLLEAMGAGLVPVVSDLPSGISEVVNDSNGIRVDIHDEEGYCNSLISLAVDPSRRAALAARAVSEVRSSHSTEAMTRRWEAMLDALLPDEMPLWKTQCTAVSPLGMHAQWIFHPLLRPLRSRWKRLSQSLRRYGRHLAP
jgi:glycosyltransferase involved in cell wall biosynthesis